MRIKKRRCDHLCQEHAFKIQCLHPQYHSPLDVNVVFCPKYHRPPKQPETLFPSFNIDKKHFTSGFILQIDKKALITNQNQVLHEHNKFVREATQKNGKVIFPKPKKRHNICGVCKAQYPNYFKHIISEQHKLKLITNQYNKEILVIASTFSSLHPKSTPQYPIQVIKIDRKKEGEQQNLLGLTEEETRQMKQEMLNSQGVIRKQIEAMIISSDQQRQQSPQSNSYYQQQQSSSSSGQHSKSKHYQTKLQQNDSDSVQIIGIKPPKKEKRSKETRPQKNKKSKQKKHKSKSRKKQDTSSSQSSDDQSSHSSQKKRGSIGKKGPDLMPEVKKPLFKKKQAPVQRKPVQVLIEKSQIENPQLDDEMQKILNSIIGGIKNCPPAQPRRKYQKGNDAFDLKSSVIGGNVLSVSNLSESKSILQLRPVEYKPQTSTAPMDRTKNHAASNLNVPKKIPPSNVFRPNPILQKLNLNLLKQKNRIGLVTKKHINENMKTTTKVQKCIDLDLDSEQIVETSCRKDKRKTQLQLIMRYDQKKLANIESVTNSHKMNENKLSEEGKE